MAWFCDRCKKRDERSEIDGKKWMTLTVQFSDKELDFKSCIDGKVIGDKWEICTNCFDELKKFFDSKLLEEK